MTTKPVTPHSVFSRLAVTLLIGLGIGFSVGYSVGKSKSAGQTAASNEKAAQSAAAHPGQAAPQKQGQPSSGTHAPQATTASTQTEEGQPPKAHEMTPPSANWPARYLFVAVKGTSLDDAAKSMLKDLKPGGVVLRSDNIDNRNQTIALVRAIKEAVGYGSDLADLPLIAVDQEGGPVNTLNLAHAPSASEVGASADLNAARDLGKEYAAALTGRNIAVLLAPVLDIYEKGDPKRAQERSFGSDNTLVAAMGLAFADGAMAGGVLPVVRDYPGYPSGQAPNGDALPVIEKDIPELAKLMFPFSESVARGIPGVLVGHIAVKAIDHSDPPLPASLSPSMINEILRKRWGYDGVVLADDLSVPVVTQGRTPADAAVAAFSAGADGALFLDPDPDHVRALCAAIDAAVAQGALSSKGLLAHRKRLDGWRSWLRNPTALKGPLLQLPQHLEVAEKPAPEKQPTPEKKAAPEPKAKEKPAIPPNAKKIVHRIERGETLSSISRQYDVTPDQLMKWNHLDDPNIKYGFNLVIYEKQDEEPAKSETKAEGEPAPSEPAKAQKAPAAASPPTSAAGETGGPEAQSGAAQSPAPASKEAPNKTPAPASDAGSPASSAPKKESAQTGAPGQPPGTKKIVHVVKRGEMLSRLAVHYGVSQQDIMKWSGFTDPIVKIGQKLIIYVPDDSASKESATNKGKEAAPPSATPDVEPATQGNLEKSLIEQETKQEKPASDQKGVDGKVPAQKTP